MTEQITCVPFSALDAAALYEILALRSAVFVVEQRCAYLDPDGEDPAAWHLLARRDGRLVGTARVLVGPWRIGRVAVHPAARGIGLGRRLVQAACDAIGAAHPIRLAAQEHLVGFYGSLGFHAVGPVHDEDGIPHVEMERPGR